MYWLHEFACKYITNSNVKMQSSVTVNGVQEIVIKTLQRADTEYYTEWPIDQQKIKQFNSTAAQ